MGAGVLPGEVYLEKDEPAPPPAPENLLQRDEEEALADFDDEQ